MANAEIVDVLSGDGVGNDMAGGLPSDTAEDLPPREDGGNMEDGSVDGLGPDQESAGSAASQSSRVEVESPHLIVASQVERRLSALGAIGSGSMWENPRADLVGHRISPSRLGSFGMRISGIKRDQGRSHSRRGATA